MINNENWNNELFHIINTDYLNATSKYEKIRSTLLRAEVMIQKRNKIDTYTKDPLINKEVDFELPPATSCSTTISKGFFAYLS